MTSLYKYCQFLGKAGASVNCKTQNYRMYLLYDVGKTIYGFKVNNKETRATKKPERGHCSFLLTLNVFNTLF